MSLEVLRSYKPDHTKNVTLMTGEEVLLEFLFLSSGFADIEEPHKGVRFGLTPSLEARKREFQEYLVHCVDEVSHQTA